MRADRFVFRHTRLGQFLAFVIIVFGATSCTKDEEAEEPVGADAEGTEEEEDAGAGEEDAAADAQSTDESEDAPEVEEDAGDAAAAAPADADTTAIAQPAVPFTGATVRYVIKGGTPVFDAPAGRQIRSLGQGDHILVAVEGEWARVHDGTFVRAADLSEKAVPRPRSRAKWK